MVTAAISRAARRSNTHTSFHSTTIKRIIERNPEVSSTGFWKAMRAVPNAPYTTDLLRADQEWFRDVKFVPDAWAIHLDQREITLFEVVATSDISDLKIARLADFAGALDQDYYSLGLIRIDEFGAKAFNVGVLGTLLAVSEADGMHFDWKQESLTINAERTRNGI